MNVRTRFAPSPTGYLHIGGVRTALFNWLFARHHGGQFILRIDDTDQQRNVEAALQPILEGLRWLGIDWDEGPEVDGPCAPYYQSQRGDRYRAAVTGLLDRGLAYRDYATPEETNAERQAAQQAKQRFIYSRRWMADGDDAATAFEAEGRRAVVRLKMPREGVCRLDDVVRGPVEFEWALEQDHVVQRPDGTHLYHLASAVDDHDFGVTHVIRAVEHLSNTPRQIFITEGLGYTLPRYAHVPYVAAPGSEEKLSKRKLGKYLKHAEFKKVYDHAAAIMATLGEAVDPERFNPVVVDFYREVGYRPDALVNYLLLLGWSLDDRTEDFSRDDMIRLFSLERVNRSAASFDPQKMMAFEERRMQAVPREEKVEAVSPYLTRIGLLSAAPIGEEAARLRAVVDAAGDRIKVAGDIVHYTEFFQDDAAFSYDENAFSKRLRVESTADRLQAFRRQLDAIDSFDATAIEAALHRYVEAEGIKIGQIIHAVRVAVTGKAVGFGLFEAMELLGRTSCLARIDRALALTAAPGGVSDGAGLDFIRQIVSDDRAAGARGGRVHTRFPPEPNGYLHIGHAKAICLNFGVAAEYGGLCNLRMDDTNPETEDLEFVQAIEEDIRWLGFDWSDRFYFASDYYERLHDCAVALIKKGLAYVDDLQGEEVSQYRGRWDAPGRNSPYRERSVDENVDLFARMRTGEFEDGARTLRAKIDMAAPNMNMRDPTIYRIRRQPHYRRGDDWVIYPTYDFTHPLSDAFEGVTHSFCTLEFEDHRPLYDWYLQALEFEDPPRQIEFARLNLTHTVLSKRRLLELVGGGQVAGWDDPRMPTLSGMRRRGYPPSAIREFCDRIGIAKANSVVQVAQLEDAVRQELNQHAARVMAVLNPLKVVIENYPEGQTEELDAVNNPEDESAGTRKVPFSRELYIERSDFREDPPKKFFRLAPGREVRLRYAYFLTCREVVKDADDNVVELRCTYDPETRGGYAPDGRKVRGTIHWVSAPHAVGAEVRLYEHLFEAEYPDEVAEGTDERDAFNPASLERRTGCWVEPGLADATAGARYQFERLGYFCVDPDSTAGAPVFNKTVGLRDTWAKIQKKEAGR